jgi:hypothetical protein
LSPVFYAPPQQLGNGVLNQFRVFLVQLIFSDVSLDNLFVSGHYLSGARSDDFAEIQHVDAVGDIHDHTQIMLHQNDCGMLRSFWMSMTNRTMSSFSSMFIPAMGSSSNSSLGPSVSALATSTRFWMP